MKFKSFCTAVAIATLIPTTLFANPTTYTKRECPNNNPYHILVNKKQGVTKSFVPQNLVVPNVKFSFSGYHEKKNLEKTTATALEELFAGAKKENIHLAAVSGYRSYDRQSQLYNNYVKRDGQAKADTYSARPGTSEHQTGLAMDVSAASVDYDLVERFGETKEGKWLKDNAHRYGFTIRYPKGKEHITGYIYEPWHIRYVGKDLAAKLYTSNLTFEEIDTCCEKIVEVPQSIPLTELTPAEPITLPEEVVETPPTNASTTIGSSSSSLPTNQIEIIIDKMLENLHVTVLEEDNTFKIIIKPNTSL